MAEVVSPNSEHDEYNSGAWEKVVHDLARLCGLDVPESKLETFSKTGSTFLVKRFDRNGSRRIHFASAMTLLGKTDGASAADGSSYLDLAAFIRANGASPHVIFPLCYLRSILNISYTPPESHRRPAEIRHRPPQKYLWRHSQVRRRFYPGHFFSEADVIKRPSHGKRMGNGYNSRP